MRFLLRLKHWQLFLLTWGIPMVVNILTFANPGLMLKLFPLMMLTFAIGTFGWVWAIAAEMHKKLPVEVDLNLMAFKIYFSMPLIYVLALIFFLGFISYSGSAPNDFIEGKMVTIILVLHLSSMVCIFMGLRFAAKTLRSVEIRRMARFGDYAGEFFLIWFSIIGYWVLQPRLNKLAEDREAGI